MLKTTTKEILVYYDANTSLGKKVLALAKSLTPHVKAIEYHKSPLTLSHLRELIDKTGLRPKDWLNRANPYYQQNLRGKDFDDESWLNIITHNPDLIRAPIVMNGNTAFICDNATDVLKII
ncbi:MAG: ArsC/Spx/MgsR family protein [Chitinophagales bacterium]|nr:glutaredoxin [Bacteroidota bacterium]